MKRTAALALLLLAGCSTHPCADLLDHFAPGRLPQAPRYYGGVGELETAAPAVDVMTPPPSESGRAPGG